MAKKSSKNRNRTLDWAKDSSMEHNVRILPHAIHYEIPDNAEDLMLEHLKTVGVQKNEESVQTIVPTSPDSVEKPVFFEIDLHGYIKEQALRRVSAFVQKQTHDVFTVRIITGKGRHSEDGQGVLIREVYLFVKSHFEHRILSIDPPPHMDLVGGLPVRGHFDVKFKKTTV